MTPYLTHCNSVTQFWHLCRKFNSDTWLINILTKLQTIIRMWLFSYHTQAKIPIIIDIMWKFTIIAVMLDKFSSLTYTETIWALCFQWFLFQLCSSITSVCTLPEEKTHITPFLWKMFQDILHLSVKTVLIGNLVEEKKR